MAHQFHHEASQGPWDQDRPPTSEMEAQLQQALWNQRLHLNDLDPQEIKRLMYARQTSPHRWAQEFRPC